MKQISILLFLLLSFQSFGQKWHLEKVEQTKEYGFEYWFQFEHIADTNAFDLTKHRGQQSSTIKLSDSHKDTIIAAILILKNIETGSILTLTSDINGAVKVSIPKGNYILTVSAINYDNFELKIKIDANEYIDLEIRMGLAPEDEICQIHSKSTLSETEIHEIMNCVKNNKQKFNKNCSKKNLYQITMQI